MPNVHICANVPEEVNHPLFNKNNTLKNKTV